MNRVLLIVIDMQNDFISGTLGTKEAQEVLPKVQEKVDTYLAKGYPIMFTLDTHDETYLETQEGKNLPVVHCVEGSKGHDVAIEAFGKPVMQGIQKTTFGSLELAERVESIVTDTVFDITEIELVGVCTDICVVSNALILKAAFPETLITVDASCCAGTTVEAHNMALQIMANCQVNIVNKGN